MFSSCYMLLNVHLSHAIHHCVKVGASNNDGQITIDWLSKERKEGREGGDEQKERRVKGWPILLCQIDKSADGESQWTQITFS